MKISFIGPIALTAIFLSLLTGYAYAEDAPTIVSSIDADELARVLTAQGWTLYGTDQCSWCIRQREEFGDAFGDLTYIDCMENRSACSDAGVQGIPCWSSPDGVLHPGYYNLTRLSELVSDYQRAHPTPAPEETLYAKATPTETVTLRPPKPIYLDKCSLTPKNPTIRVGEALSWINLQQSPRIDFILVSEDGLWDDQTIGYGKKFKYTFNKPGSYTYYCPGYGSSMRGTVTVSEFAEIYVETPDIEETPAVTPTPTEAKFRIGPTVTLRPVNDVIDRSQNGLVELYMNNPPLNDVTLTVNVRISAPSGIHVYGEGINPSGAAGIAGGTFEIPPGTVRTIHINIEGESVGTFTAQFTGLYWAGDNKDAFQQISQRYMFTVNELSPDPTDLEPTGGDGGEELLKEVSTPKQSASVHPTYLLLAAAAILIALIFMVTFRKKKPPASPPPEPAPPSPPEPTPPEPAQTPSIPPPSEIAPHQTTPATHFTTHRTVWDPSNKDFVWDAGKPDEYGELPRIKEWLKNKNPNIYWFLLKIANHTDHPVTEWNVTLHTEQALTILEAHLDEKQVRIVKSDFDTDNNRNICVVAIPPELGVSIPANGGRRSMYFKMDIRCEDALKMEFGVSGVAKLGKSPQIEVPIREKRFTYACKYGDFENMFRGSPDTLASQVMENLQNPDNRGIMQNFTNSFRLIRDFEKYCNDRYAESEVLIGKLEVIHSSLKAAEPITKDEILPCVEENLTVLQKMGGIEAQKERGMRMCEKLVELLHIATSKIK